MIYPFNKKILISFIGLGLIFFILQCGYYSFSGSLPPHLKTIAIPLFDDQTAEFGLKEELTDAVIERFTKDNSLKITDRGNANVLLEGGIVSVRDQTGGFDREENVQDMKVYCTVRIKCTDLKKRKILWEESISRWGRFDPGNIGSRRDGISEALKEIAEEILNKTVSGW